ncbi:MAG: MFS transporter [Chloroflexi bacterium]|nr:MFS transporter [Chloroflexota bacterium]
MIRNVLRAPALRLRDFRILCLSTVFETAGFAGEQVILGWLVLELTGSPFMVGAAIGARSAPYFFLGIVAGTIADLVDRRGLMRLLNLAMVLITAALGLLIYLNKIEVWHFFVMAVLAGCIGALYQTSRQSLAFDVAGEGNRMSGLSYVSLSMRFGGLLGSLAAGFIFARIGADVAYFAVAAAYVVSALSLSFMRSQSRPPLMKSRNVLQSLKELGAEVRVNRPLLVLIVMVALVELLGFSHAALMPSLARDVLHVGPEGLGVMIAFQSVGAVVALVVALPFGDTNRKGLIFLIVILVFGVSLMMLGLTTSFVAALLVIAVMSAAMALSDLFSQGLIQAMVPRSLRGRAMGAWVVAVGTAPLGNLQIGGLAAAIGVSVALMTNGTVLLVLGVGALLLFPRLRRL